MLSKITQKLELQNHNILGKRVTIDKVEELPNGMYYCIKLKNDTRTTYAYFRISKNNHRVTFADQDMHTKMWTNYNNDYTELFNNNLLKDYSDPEDLEIYYQRLMLVITSEVIKMNDIWDESCHY